MKKRKPIKASTIIKALNFVTIQVKEGDIEGALFHSNFLIEFAKNRDIENDLYLYSSKGKR